VSKKRVRATGLWEWGGEKCFGGRRFRLKAAVRRRRGARPKSLLGASHGKRRGRKQAKIAFGSTRNGAEGFIRGKRKVKTLGIGT